MKSTQKNIFKRLLFLIIMVIISFIIIFISKLDIAPTSTVIADTSYFFDTFVTITIYESDKDNIEKDTELISKCFDICKQYEEIFSATLENSELYKLNESDAKFFKISNELADILNLSYEYNLLTNGAFNVSIGNLSDLWNFKNEKIPTDEDIKNAMSAFENSLYSIKDNAIIWNTDDKIPDITLGGIAKGYIADKLKEYLLSHNITSGIINLGGNVLLLGNKPDNSNFTIGITKPFTTTGENITSITLSDMSVVTSGIYERYFMADNKIYHHILDPQTGYPVQNDLYSVTIISDSSTFADALSTSVYVMGMDKGLELINSIDNVYAVFINKNYEIKLSNGLSIDNNIISIINEN